MYKLHAISVITNHIYVPVNRFFPLRSYTEEGPLLDGLVSGSRVVIATVVAAVVEAVAAAVVVTGGCVVDSSGKSAYYSKCYVHFLRMCNNKKKNTFFFALCSLRC